MCSLLWLVTKIGVANGKYCYSVVIFSDQAPVVQKLDSAILRINHYPVDKTVLGILIALSSR